MHKTQAFQPIRALQSAWDILMKAPLPMWVGGLILFSVELAGGSSGGAGDFKFSSNGAVDQIVWLVVPIVGLGLVLSVAMVAVTSWLKLGYYQSVETVMRTGEVEFDQLYRKSDRWVSVFLVHLLQLLLILLMFSPYFFAALLIVGVGKGLDFDEGAVAALVGVSYLMYIPVFIYLLLGVLLMPFAAALDGCRPMEALSKSWNLANGIRWQLFLMFLLQVGISLLGCCAFCVGIFPAGIIGHVMWTEAYIQATRDDLGDWWINKRGLSPKPGSEAGERKESPRDVSASAAPPVVPAKIPAQSTRVAPVDLVQEDEAPAQRTTNPEDKQDSHGSSSAFDPGAWRQDLDTPSDDDPTS